MSTIPVYHTGFFVIDDPDLNHGRKNADFGPGFYVSTDYDFVLRWAKSKKDTQTYLNEYSLDLDGLNIKRLSRDEEWFDFIFQNRKGQIEQIPQDLDIIIGPIANDTIYDSFGILTSGLVEKEQALEILRYGNAYEQLVIRSEKAKAQLKWEKATRFEAAQLAASEAFVKSETEKFQNAIAQILSSL